MKKTVIKCDICKKELITKTTKKDGDTYYYELNFRNLGDWSRVTRSMDDFHNSLEICQRCAEEKNIDFKK